MDTFSFQASWYQVETRSRVIILDIAGFEAGKTLQRRSSSLLSHAVHHSPAHLARDHVRLMSWPDHLSKEKLHHNDVGKANEPENLSARALQLSIYGSTVRLNNFS